MTSLDSSPMQLKEYLPRPLVKIVFEYNNPVSDQVLWKERGIKAYNEECDYFEFHEIDDDNEINNTFVCEKNINGFSKRVKLITVKYGEKHEVKLCSKRREIFKVSVWYYYPMQYVKVFGVMLLKGAIEEYMKDKDSQGKIEYYLKNDLGVSDDDYKYIEWNGRLIEFILLKLTNYYDTEDVLNWY